jgi:hypothetical protein
MRNVACCRVVQGSYSDTYRVTPSAYPIVVRTHEEGGNTRPVFAALASSGNLSGLPPAIQTSNKFYCLSMSPPIITVFSTTRQWCCLHSF